MMVPTGAAAQTARLEFRPPVGMGAHILSYFDVRTRLEELGGGGLTTEVAGMRSLSFRVTGTNGSSATVEVTLDSLRYRWRPGGSLWTTVADTAGARPSLALAVDPRMRIDVVASELGGIEGSRGSLRAFAGGFESSLPDGVVAAGHGWQAEMVVPWQDPTGLDDDPEVGRWIRRAGAMISRASFTVDSVVDRGADTLAYVVFRGTFLPATLTTAAESAEGNARVTGAIAGRLIWSSGWHTWVSGAMQYTVRLVVLRGLPHDEEVVYTMVSDVSNRFRVRQ